MKRWVTMVNIEQGNVLLKFSADWCGPCKAFAPVIKKIAEEFTTLKIESVDIEEKPELAKQFRVKSIPTVILLKDGKVIESFTGTLPLESVRQKVKNLIG